ncbi:hypothetical protein [Deinococcus yavapaiensis]|uniref:Uncharacterized protein n=1 Tax=Deinococcus yavapaiensis KR-236 TaxID=694435 RepID=A0A318SMY7_9DEIO|nr:hypothetical protein [Deinococcus yavapaiensis]PYE53921.1 hypothetical protein DES52_107179 [Deinococcus yavapaiensis KR-236]
MKPITSTLLATLVPDVLFWDTRIADVKAFTTRTVTWPSRTY